VCKKGNVMIRKEKGKIKPKKIVNIISPMYICMCVPPVPNANIGGDYLNQCVNNMRTNSKSTAAAMI
jgi:hypothetical protein